MVAKSIVSQLGAHLSLPLFRNAYALMLSTGLTSALGFVYWLLAARLYPAEVVGQNSAILSAVMFLGGVAQLNLANVLIRFIPAAGAAARRLEQRATLATVAAGLVAGVGFLLTVGLWAPSLGFLGESPLVFTAFTLATVSWGVFVLQEGALTGLRQAVWVPARNLGFALGKIALLVAFSILLPADGIVVSWLVTAALLVAPTGFFIRRELSRRVPAPDEPGLAQVSSPEVLRYAAADYAGALAWLAATMLVPVLVAEVAGPTATAHFYLAWTIAYTLYLVAPGMGSSLIVESTLDPGALDEYARRALLQTARLVLPLAALLIVFAPYVLRLLGDSYAAEGTTLVRLLALSAVPNTINALFTSVARAQRRLVLIVATLGAQCLLVLSLSYMLLNTLGIVGVGWAWLISQSVVAAVLLVCRRRLLRPAPELNAP